MIKRIVVAAALTLLTASCTTGEGDPTVTDAPEETSIATEVPETDEVTVDLGEWSVLPDPEGVRADELTFNARNVGKEAHELAIVKTDVEADELPTLEDGSVDEDKVDVVERTKQIDPGKESDLKVDLDAGSYVLMCNVVHTSVDHEDHEETEVHYELGMRTAFEVS